MAGYLFAHFIGEEKGGEQIYFALSRDGLHWKDLNGGRPILYSRTGSCGVRDPFLVRDPNGKKVYLIATDLRIEAGKGWHAAEYEGSRNLIIWESEDLVHWGRERSVQVGIPKAGCVWAPEAVYDKEKKAFLVFFASMTPSPTLPVETSLAEPAKVSPAEPVGAPETTSPAVRGKQKIYAAYTEDFHTFSETFLYMERENHVIDSTILESGNRYFRISKDETEKRLILEVADSLLGEFRQIDSPILANLKGVEGPEGYLLPDGKTWCLIADQFAEGKGYLPMVTGDLSSGKFRILEPDEYDMGENKKRHGGILQISDEEYERLSLWFGGKNPVIEGLYADPDLYYEDGIYYIYPTTDGFVHWSGSEFYVFAAEGEASGMSGNCVSGSRTLPFKISENGWHFEKKAKILDVASDDVPWATGSAWAPCITKRGNRYYFYFCAKDQRGISCIGVATADSPTGPFKAMDQPMVTMEMMAAKGISMCQTIDPSIYEEDGEWYLLFGNGHGAIAKLTDDMCHIEEATLKNIEGLYDFRESVIVFKRNGLYHFTWSCDDTGSENYHVNYGVAKELCGPVAFRKTILQKDPGRDILGTGHHSILKMPDQDQYLIAYHRFATPLSQYPEENGKGWYRETCLAPLSFDEEGYLMPVVVL